MSYYCNNPNGTAGVPMQDCQQLPADYAPCNLGDTQVQGGVTMVCQTVDTYARKKECGQAQINCTGYKNPQAGYIPPSGSANVFVYPQTTNE